MPVAIKPATEIPPLSHNSKHFLVYNPVLCSAALVAGPASKFGLPTRFPRRLHAYLFPPPTRGRRRQASAAKRLPLPALAARSRPPQRGSPSWLLGCPHPRMHLRLKMLILSSYGPGAFKYSLGIPQRTTVSGPFLNGSSTWRLRRILWSMW